MRRGSVLPKKSDVQEVEFFIGLLYDENSAAGASRSPRFCPCIKPSMMQNKFLISTSLLSLLFFGAGCAWTNGTDSQIPEVPAQTPAPALNPSPSETPVTPPVKTWSAPVVLPSAEIENKVVRISTAKGDIAFELFPKTAPLTVSNFVTLANGGFYDNIIFHRRADGFVIQGGDPSGNGTGGPGYTFADELKDSYAYKRGIVAMANRGPDTNGSQFFIMLADVPLPKNYSIFGRVISGMDVVDNIQIGDVMKKVTVDAAGKK